MAAVVLTLSSIFPMTLPLRLSSRFFKCLAIIGWPLALLVALVLPGCSAIRLGYNSAPEVSYWWLDSYLDFNSEQALKVRADLNAVQSWHRQKELPLYVTTLEKLQTMAPGQVTPEQMCEIYAGLRGRFQTLVEQTEPLISAIAPTLKPEQLDHLARQLDKRSVKWREEWLDGSLTERRARRVKQLQDRAESFYGRLEEPQLALLRANVAASSFDPVVSYQESTRRHQDTLQTLRQIQSSKPAAQTVNTQVHALLERAMNSPDTAYRNYMDKVTLENCKAFAVIHNSSTPAQRTKLAAALKDYEMDARALMLKR